MGNHLSTLDVCFVSTSSAASPYTIASFGQSRRPAGPVRQSERQDKREGRCASRTGGPSGKPRGEGAEEDSRYPRRRPGRQERRACGGSHGRGRACRQRAGVAKLLETRAESRGRRVILLLCCHCAALAQAGSGLLRLV